MTNFNIRHTLTPMRSRRTYTFWSSWITRIAGPTADKRFYSTHTNARKLFSSLSRRELSVCLCLSPCRPTWAKSRYKSVNYQRNTHEKKNNTHCNWFALLCVSSISRTVHNGEMLTTYSTNKISFQHKPYLAHLVYGDMALFDFHSAKHSLYLAGFAAPLRPDTPNGTTTHKKTTQMFGMGFRVHGTIHCNRKRLFAFMAIFPFILQLPNYGNSSIDKAANCLLFCGPFNYLQFIHFCSLPPSHIAFMLTF